MHKQLRQIVDANWRPCDKTFGTNRPIMLILKCVKNVTKSYFKKPTWSIGELKLLNRGTLDRLKSLQTTNSTVAIFLLSLSKLTD